MDNKLSAGDKVIFSRGMFGKWTGTVVRTYCARKNNTGMVLVDYTRANGSLGQYRAQYAYVQLVATKEQAEFEQLVGRASKLMNRSAQDYLAPKNYRVREELMAIGGKLTRGISGFQGINAFEEMLDAWERVGYRPTLCRKEPRAALLARIYNFVQYTRGVDVEAFQPRG